MPAEAKALTLPSCAASFESQPSGLINSSCQGEAHSIRLALGRTALGIVSQASSESSHQSAALRTRISVHANKTLKQKRTRGMRLRQAPLLKLVRRNAGCRRLAIASQRAVCRMRKEHSVLSSRELLRRHAMSGALSKRATEDQHDVHVSELISQVSTFYRAANEARSRF